MKYDDLKLEHDEEIIIKGNYAYTQDKDGHLKRIFEVVKGDFRELDLTAITEKVANYLKDKVDVKEFLIDFLSVKFEPEGLIKLEKRVDMKAQVQSKGGCYYLDVFGERKPIRLWLVEPNWLE